LNVAVTMAVQTLLLNNGFYQNNDADFNEAD
jgi:hypothetical protein